VFDGFDVDVELGGKRCASIAWKLPTRSTAGLPNAPLAYANPTLVATSMIEIPPAAKSVRFRFMGRLPDRRLH
jgi:hypothetical protein